jgi:hypothetical protein
MKHEKGLQPLLQFRFERPEGELWCSLMPEQMQLRIALCAIAHLSAFGAKMGHPIRGDWNPLDHLAVFSCCP